MIDRKKLNKIKKCFVFQQDEADCGISCLLSIIRFHDGDTSMESLREKTGTTTLGANFLGLYQASLTCGLQPTGLKLSLNDLIEITEPCILHLTLENGNQHFAVFFGIKTRKLNSKENIYLIGDPARGIIELNESQLMKIWLSKTILRLLPSESFLKQKVKSSAKRKWFYKILKADIDLLLLTIALGIVYTIIGLLLSIFSQKLIDRIIPTKNISFLLTSIIILFSIYVISSIIGYIRQEFLIRQGRNFNNRILENFFQILLHLPKPFFDSRKIGDIVNRIGDTSKIQANISYMVGSFCVDIILIVASSIFLLKYSLFISFITFAFIPIIAMIAFFFSRPLKREQQTAMGLSSQMSSNYIDTIQGIPVIKSFNKQNAFSDTTRVFYTHYQEQLGKLGRIGNRYGLTMELLGALIAVVLIGTTGYLVMIGQMKIGEMVAVISLSGRLIPSVSRISQINLKIQETKIAFDRMYDFTDLEPEDLGLSEKIENINVLKLTNVSFGFPGRAMLLKDISLTVKKNEMVILLGESGSGKSTIIQLIQKFYKLTGGSIASDTIDIWDLDTTSWRKLVGVVPQDIKIFNGTILYNICLQVDRELQKSAIEFIDSIGFGTYFSGFPQSYFTVIGEDGINISGGQKQVLGVLRALFFKPKFLILDEATSGIDRNTEKKIIDILISIKKNVGILWVTHKVQTANIADQIYVIESGVIKDVGTPFELSMRDNLFSQMLKDIT